MFELVYLYMYVLKFKNGMINTRGREKLERVEKTAISSDTALTLRHVIDTND